MQFYNSFIYGQKEMFFWKSKNVQAPNFFNSKEKAKIF